MRLIRLTLPTLMALALSGATVPANATAASSSLTGAGSGLAAPLVVEWGVAYQSFKGTTVNYTPDGSQAGINDVASRAVDFGSTDAPMTTSQWNACKGCYQLPWALSAVGIGYHLNGLGRQLYLSGGVLAQIYLGQITRWNDKQIKAINPKATLPNLKITPIYSNGSEATYPFTRYLSKVSSSWNKALGYGLVVAFPTGQPSTSNSATVSLLSSTNGSIAYIGAAYLFANKLPAAAIENAAGRFEYPNFSNVESAGKTVGKIPVNNTLQIVDPPARAKIAYPISTYLYAIVAGNAARKSELEAFLSFVFGTGRQFGETLDFVPLPSNVLNAAKATLSAFESSR